MLKILFNHRVLLLLVLSALLFKGWMGERIPAHNQTGWDGKHYAYYAINFPEKVMNKEIDSYHFFRIAPSCFVYLLMKLFHIQVSMFNIVQTFIACNTFLILFVAVYYFLLCKHFAISWQLEIIGFAALFFNFVILKHSYYYPVLTDVFAFAFGFIAVGEFLMKRTITTFIAIILGTFTYPLFFVTTAIFLIPFKSIGIKNYLQPIFKSAKFIVPVLLIIVFIIYLFYGKQLILADYQMPINSFWIVVSFPALIFYAYKLFDINFSPEKIEIRKINDLKILLIGAIIIFIYFLLNYVVKQISIPETDFTPATFLWNVFQQSISKPFSFLVFHFVYYGPMIFLLMLFYKKWVMEISSMGWQLPAFIFIYLLLAIGTESRQFINAWPAIVLSFIFTFKEIKFNKKFVIIFLLVSLFQSHFWVHINWQNIYETTNFNSFPEQFYFMHQGPFASDISYGINALCFISFFMLFVLLIKKNQRKNFSFLN